MNTQTKEQLTAEKTALLAKLNGSNHNEIFPLLKENENALKQLAKVQLLKDVNSKYSRLRELAKQAFECEQPTEDITTNGGDFHKTKVKKYPKIAALKYADATWKDDRITKLTINGESFYMYATKHEYNKPTEYTRPETFTDFLKLNTIPTEDITMQQYSAMCDKLDELNRELKADIEKYKQGLESINYSSLSHWGLLGQHNVNLYEYIPNK